MTRDATCIDCEEPFTYEYTRGPYHKRCTGCAQKRRRNQKTVISRGRYARNPEYCRKQAVDSHRRTRFGLTPEMFQQMLIDQDNRCAACGRTESGTRDWHVDHNHETGKVRGLLCYKCNTALGMADDSAERLLSLHAYLVRTGG